METQPRKTYQTEVRDDAWAFVAPYLVVMDERAPQRRYPLRERVNGLRFIVRTGLHRRMMPHDLPPWPAVS